MRRRLLLGVGLAGVLSGSAAAQFAADAKPLPPQTKAAPFGGAQPPAPTTPPRNPATPPAPGYVQPVGGFQPAPASPPATGFTPAGIPTRTTPATSIPPVEIPTSLGPNHPWLVKPEHGEHFICVKSYARKARPDDGGYTAKQLAEALGTEIRETHKTNVFLFEHISDERKAEEAAIAAAKKQQLELNSRIDEYRHRAQLQGMEFLGGDSKIRYKTVNYTEQIAVLVGPFKDEVSARKALDVVKKWPPPKQDFLMDGGAIARQGPNGASIEKTRINPFTQAMVVPNPTVSRQRTAGQADRLEDFVVKLNEDRPYSLLKATKGWTLGVKSFTAPITVISGGEENGGMRASGAKGGDALKAGAVQAEALAKAIREMRSKTGQPLNLEAFVLHTRTASIVTVGQFDGPNDPSLIETHRLLVNMTFKTTEDKQGTRGVMNTGKVFSDNITPIPIPRK